MTVLEFKSEVVNKDIRDYAPIMFQPKANKHEDLINRLKSIEKELGKIQDSPLDTVLNKIDTIIYNLQLEIDELENTADPKPILLDNFKEVWIDHEQTVVLGEVL
jgi:hypothetical protein